MQLEFSVTPFKKIVLDVVDMSLDISMRLAENITSIQGNVTLGSVMSIPMRKMSSAMKRLMHRFLWIVFLSLCSPRKKQKVKMLMARQMRDTTMPTRLMTLNKSSWTLSAP